MTKNPQTWVVPESMLGQTAAAEASRNLVAEIDSLRKRNADLHELLLRAQFELEKIRTLADLERINPIRYRSEP